jgi:hypothetical protein
VWVGLATLAATHHRRKTRYARRVRAAILLLFVACNATHNPITAPGTVLIDWDNTKATRPGVKTATVGPHIPMNYQVSVAHEGAPDITYDLHLELAPLDYEEGGTHAHHLAAVVIKATVKDNTGWDLSGDCESGPDYQMGAIDTKTGQMDAPLAMIERCMLHEHRVAGRVFKSSWAVGTWLEIYGDGTVKSMSDGVTITPR